MPNIWTFDRLTDNLYSVLNGTKRLINNASRKYIYTCLAKQINPGVSPGLIYEAMDQITQLMVAGISPEHLDAIPDIDSEMDTFLLELFREYQIYLSERNLVDRNLLIVELIELLSGFDLPEDLQIPWKQLVIDGFLDFTPIQVELLIQLNHRLSMIFFWPGDPNRQDIYGFSLNTVKLAFPNAEWTRNRFRDKHHEWFTDLTEHLFSDSKEPVNTHNRLRLLRASSLRREITLIAEDIKSRLITNSNVQCNQICVTCPNVNDYIPHIHWLFTRYGIPYNVSLAEKLRDSPLFNTIRILFQSAEHNRFGDILKLISDPFIRMPSQTATTRKLITTIKKWSAELKIPDDSTDFLGVIRRKVLDEENSSNSENVRELIELQGLLTDCLAVIAPLNEATTPIKYFHVLRKVLDRLQLQTNLQTFSREYQRTLSIDMEKCVRAYGCLLNFFDDIDAFIEVLNPAEIRSSIENQTLFFNLVSNEEYQVIQRAENQVQILGLLETRGLSFQHIYFCGLTESAFPKNEPPSILFRNTDLLHELKGTTGYSPEYAAGTDLIRLLQASINSFTVSWPGSKDDSPLLPSMMIYDLIAACAGVDVLTVISSGIETGKNPTEHHWSMDNCNIEHIEKSTEAFCIKTHLSGIAESAAVSPILKWFDAPAYDARLQFAQLNAPKETEGPSSMKASINSDLLLSLLNHYYGPEKPVPVTHIERYLQCPINYFFKYLCRLDETEDVEIELTPLERGLFFHEIMQRFVRLRITENSGSLASESPENNIKRLKKIANDIFNEIGKDNVIARAEYLDFTGYSDNDQSCLAGRITDLESMFTPKHTSCDVEWAFGDSLQSRSATLKLNSGIEVSLKGRIDRIDRINQDYIVIDYKTGAIPSSKELMSMTAIQLGAYVLAIRKCLGRTPAAALFYQISSKHGVGIVPAIALSSSADVLPISNYYRRNRCLSKEAFNSYLNELEERICNAIEGMMNGKYPLRIESSTCQFCNFSYLCRKNVEGDKDQHQ